MSVFLVPFLTSLGALTIEFACIHFLSMSVGSSAFGSSFVIGLFLLSMGAGSWWADSGKAGSPLKTLFAFQLLLCVLCLAYLPLAVGLSSALKSLTLEGDFCRSLLCGNEGLGLIFFHVLYLTSTGFLIGAEVPFFSKVFGNRLGGILAADYAGAFVAGLLFPFALLPKGLWMTFLFSLFCYLVASGLLAFKNRPQVPLWFRPALIAAAAVWLAGVLFAEKIETRLIEILTNRPEATESKVVYYRQSPKQQILVKDELVKGEWDRRLYLDGFMQFSSRWNAEGYHRAMVLPARRSLGDRPRSVLILGGGDGLAASMLLQHYPRDRVRVVDFDCELIDEVRDKEVFRTWISSEDAGKVDWVCGDAFWYVRHSTEKFDLILVDFPHGVGDAAALRVESLEFFTDAASVLAPEGRLVLQHERYLSAERECVENTLHAAGFQTRADEVLPGRRSSEAMIQAWRGRAIEVDGPVQTRLGAPCFSPATLRHLWLGS